MSTKSKKSKKAKAGQQVDATQVDAVVIESHPTEPAASVMPRAAARVAALTAMKDALEVQIRLAKAAALDEARQNDVRSFNTPFGAVNVVQKDPAVTIREAAAVEWAKVNDPDKVITIEVLPDWYLDQLKKNLVVIDGQAYPAAEVEGAVRVDGELFNPQGEPIDPAPYASVGDLPEPYIAWGASKQQKDAKAAAIAYVEQNTAAITASLLELGR